MATPSLRPLSGGCAVFLTFYAAWRLLLFWALTKRQELSENRCRLLDGFAQIERFVLVGFLKERHSAARSPTPFQKPLNPGFQEVLVSSSRVAPAASFSRARSLGFENPDELLLASRLLSELSDEGPLFSRVLSGRAPRATDAPRARIEPHCVELPRALLGDLPLGVDSTLGREIALASAEWALKEPGLFFAADLSAASTPLQGLPSLDKFREAKNQAAGSVPAPRPRSIRAG